MAQTVELNTLTKEFGKGEISLKKNIKVSFVYNETERAYHAKILYRYDKLFLSETRSNGLTQVFFNAYQDLKLKKARFYKLDSLNKKVLVENVKVRYADIKDYYISGIFYSDLKVKQFRSSVELPENYLLSYSYELIIKDLKFLNLFYLQESDEAVKEVELSIKKDVNVDLAVIEKNFGKKVTKTEDDNYIKFKAKNLKRKKTSPWSVGSSYYLPHVIVSVKSTETPEKQTNILSSTKDQYDWYNTLIKELKPDDAYLKSLSSKIVSSEMSDQEKISSIYRWVQKNIQYVAFEDGIAGFKPEEAVSVSKLKYGDCKGMANLLVNLLRVEGFDARHTWIGTRKNNYSYSIPSLVVDNHMICALNFNNQFYFLDGTSKSATWDNPPPHLQGKEALIANGENYEIQTVPISNAQDNKILITGSVDFQKTTPTIELKVTLSGDFLREYSGYQKYSSKSDQRTLPYYYTIQRLDGLHIKNVSAPEISREKISYTLNGDFLNFVKGNNQLTVFPFLNPIDVPAVAKNTSPNYIDFPHEINVQIKLKNVPAGSSNAFEQNFKDASNNLVGEYQVKHQGNETMCSQKIAIQLLHTSNEHSNNWNSFINQVDAFNNYPLTYGSE